MEVGYTASAAAYHIVPVATATARDSVDSQSSTCPARTAEVDPLQKHDPWARTMAAGDETAGSRRTRRRVLEEGEQHGAQPLTPRGAPLSPALAGPMSSDSESSVEEDPIITKLMKSLKKQNRRNDKKWDRRISSITGTFEEKLVASEKRQDAKWELRLQEMRTAILSEVGVRLAGADGGGEDDLRLRVAALERAGSGAASVTGSVGSAQAPRVSEDFYAAAWVKIRGFVKVWDNLEEEGLSHTEAKNFLAAIQSKYTLAIAIDWPKSTSSSSSRNSNAEVILYLGRASTDDAWKIKRHYGLDPRELAASGREAYGGSLHHRPATGMEAALVGYRREDLVHAQGHDEWTVPLRVLQARQDLDQALHPSG